MANNLVTILTTNDIVNNIAYILAKILARERWAHSKMPTLTLGANTSFCIEACKASKVQDLRSNLATEGDAIVKRAPSRALCFSNIQVCLHYDRPKGGQGICIGECAQRARRHDLRHTNAAACSTSRCTALGSSSGPSD